MPKTIRNIFNMLLIGMLLFGCACNGAKTAGDSALSTVNPATDPTAAAVIGEDIVSAGLRDTPIPEETVAEPSEAPQTELPETPEPIPTGTPVPTDTPEPNPYIGVWTIEDLPFSVELREDGTYLITVSEEEREGAYTYNSAGVILAVDDDRTVELHYYAKADALKIDDFKLIRDDLVFYFDIGGIPVSFQAENDDLSVITRGAVVEAQTKNGKKIRSFCFTNAGLVPPDDSRDWFDATDAGTASESIHTFKYDGSYTLWTKDTEGSLLTPIDVTVLSGFRYPIRADGIDYLHKPLRRFLRDRGTGIDELNRLISRNVTAAGLYTRAGAVTAGVSLISALSKYGYSVGYQENGTYQKEQEWGVNPVWGARLGMPEEETDEEIESVDSYVGMNSEACIVWAYKQAGLNLCADAKTEIGTLGERENMHDNLIDADRAESGDIIKYGGRHAMVIDRLDRDGDGRDDSYLTYEMASPVLTVEILSFDELQRPEVFSMDAFFDGTGRCTWKVRFWSDTFQIPSDQFPMYLKETIETENTQKGFMNLLEKLGF